MSMPISIEPLALSREIAHVAVIDVRKEPRGAHRAPPSPALSIADRSSRKSGGRNFRVCASSSSASTGTRSAAPCGASSATTASTPCSWREGSRDGDRPGYRSRRSREPVLLRLSIAFLRRSHSHLRAHRSSVLRRSGRQIALMHRTLVEEKKWLDEPRFHPCAELLHAAAGSRGDAACHLLRLADVRRAGRPDGGLLFVLPGALVLTALSAVYLVAGHLTVAQGLLFA